MAEEWTTNSQQNVFEMLVDHGGPGFWIRRTTWGATLARVVCVGSFTGPPPYFGNPSMLMDVYSLDGDLKDALAAIPVPGTYKTWRKIEAPPWAGQTALRPPNDPSAVLALSKLDHKRGKNRPKGESPVHLEHAKIPLSVPFARKEEAKAIGARWSAADKTWWLSPENSTALLKARDLGFLPL